jgi:hypothetical protein
MAALLQKARRSAILRKARHDLAAAAAAEQEVTPAPVAVGSLGAPEAPPSPVSRAARPRGTLLAGLLGLGLFAAGALAVARAPRAAAELHGARGLRESAALFTQALAPSPEPEPPVTPASMEGPAPDSPSIVPLPRADAHVNRDGYGHIPGGVVFVPSTFSSDDGVYDLYLHFHGNTRVVLESAEYAGLNAVVAVVNLGVNSAPYLDAYDTPGTYERTLAAVGRALGERGLDHAHLRRVAIGSWSGGYGAVSKILDHDTGTESLDAVLVLDGIHCGFLDEGHAVLNALIISPFLRAAKRAAEGRLLFSITHSEIDPIAYAGTYLTAGYLLDAVHGHRGEPLAAPEHVQLRAAEGAVAKRLEKRMEPISEATVGSFHVRGYRGNTAEHHMAHLLQMGATVMPELVRRWQSTTR